MIPKTIDTPTTPGTPTPTMFRLVQPPRDFSEDYPVLVPYMEESLWREGLGVGVLIKGGAGVGKTTLARDILAEIHRTHPEVRIAYWSEPDYWVDAQQLQRYERMTTDLVRNDDLWQEYLDWERGLQALKDITVLVWDDAGTGRSPAQLYAVENLIRYRDNQDLATITVIQTHRWALLPEAMQSLYSRNAMTVTVGDPVISATPLLVADDDF